jgi:hypothetical protein
MKDEYTFVTLDNDMVTTGDAVFFDVDASAGSGFVQVDETYSFDADFIMVDDSVGDMDIDFSSDISEADLMIAV